VGDRLYRSVTDRSLSGVCGGLAAWLGLDPSLVRIGWVVLAIVSGGAFVLLYIAMAIIVPEAPEGWVPRSGAGQAGPPAWGPGSAQGWGSSAPGGAWSGTAGWQGGTGAPGAPGSAEAGTQGLPSQPGQPGQWNAPSSWPEDWGRQSAWQRSGSPFGADRSGLVIGGVLIALGAWFLVRQYISINWDLVWPVAVIAVGGVLIASAMRRTR
jgi:phage shock protein C